MFCHFRTGRTSCAKLWKPAFSAQDQHVLSFAHWAHFFLATFNNGDNFVQNSVFSLKQVRFVIFKLGAPPFSYFKESARVCTKQSFQQEVSTFPRFRTGRTTFKRFLVSARVCTKQRFQPKTSTFCHFCTGRPLFTLFSKAHQFVQSSVFSPRSERFVIFPLGSLLFSHF